ncbi:MAG: beta-N-acetylhexosaminidase [Betaproteobacteria bacterium]|nr:beta-N-acetylhexosaminidase [Betaproteobacteria bacterium]
MSLGPVMLDIEGTQLNTDDIRRLEHPLTGGVILFSRNYENSHQLTELTNAIHAIKKPHLLIAVDHEGGRVQRFRNDFTHLPPMRELGFIWNDNPTKARQFAKHVGFILAAELNACGVDLSFTPVLDIDHGQSSVIGDRAFHRNPQVVAELARHLMTGLELGGMSAVGKHFPGHGYIQADSHIEKSVDNRSYVDIEMDDLIPFRSMIDFGLAGVMSAHVIYPQIDKLPAGFSKMWLQKILRTDLQFDGCIFSDDLSMHGVAHFNSINSRANAALNAGCDMILVCNNPQASDELLASLQWEMPAASLSRLAKMRCKKQFESMTKLHENTTFTHAIKQISAIELSA